MTLPIVRPNVRSRSRLIAVMAGLLFSMAFSGLLDSTDAIGEPCILSTRNLSEDQGYGFEEVNNCPPINGVFQNEQWRVEFGHWEPTAFLYRGTNRQNGDFIELINDELQGTTDHPEYIFRKGDMLYSVAFRPTEPNTIRLQVFQGDRRILNQLLTRIAQ